MSRKSLMI